MWTPTTRVRHGRSGLHRGTDLIGGEGLVLEPLLS